MINLAGRNDCDDFILQELELALIPYKKFGFEMDGEVPTHHIGFLAGWKFTRARYYWVARSSESLLLFKYADELHGSFGKDVRVAGNCGCPAPREWYKNTWYIGVSLYHVDTQMGLRALADAIKKQTGETGKK